jgi:hypothetical protein
MNESIYHVYANYCGKRRLLFAGYASRVARRLGMQPSLLASIGNKVIPIHFAPTCDRFGNRMPYQLWSGLADIVRIPNPEMEIAE